MSIGWLLSIMVLVVLGAAADRARRTRNWTLFNRLFCAIAYALIWGGVAFAIGYSIDNYATGYLIDTIGVPNGEQTLPGWVAIYEAIPSIITALFFPVLGALIGALLGWFRPKQFFGPKTPDSPIR